MKTRTKVLFFAALVAVTISSCKKDDDNVKNPGSGNEEEVITTMQVTLTDSANTALSWTFEYDDPDGDGGSAPTADTIHLQTNKTYYAKVVLLDRTKTPVDTVSNEVKAEKNDHLFVYEPHHPLVSVTITDEDGNGLPLGLESTWRTNASAGNTHIHITLKHQAGIKDGDPELGETDIEATYQVVVQ